MIYKIMYTSKSFNFYFRKIFNIVKNKYADSYNLLFIIN